MLSFRLAKNSTWSKDQYPEQAEACATSSPLRQLKEGFPPSNFLFL